VSVKGVEDLGGGLSAIFLYEGDFHIGSSTGTNTSTSVGTTGASGLHAIGSGGGEAYAGLAGAFGSIKLGAPNTPTLEVQSGRQPFGTKIGSGFSSTGGALGIGHVRNDGSVVYATPKMTGFVASLGYTPRAEVNASGSTTPGASVQPIAGLPAGFPGAPTATGAIVDLGLSYGAGPLRVGYTHYRQNAAGAFTTDNKQNNLYVQADVGPATLYAGYHNETSGLGADSRGYNLAAKYAVSPGINLLANWARLDDRSGADRDRRIAALGAEYLLSKRSTVYARYVDDKTDNPALTAPAKVKTTLIGLQHNF
jgi:predicted porin